MCKRDLIINVEVLEEKLDLLMTRMLALENQMTTLQETVVSNHNVMLNTLERMKDKKTGDEYCVHSEILKPLHSKLKAICDELEQVNFCHLRNTYEFYLGTIKEK